MGAGTPLLFGTVGEIMSEKVGHLNLGVEGMMAVGAVAGFAAGYMTGNLAAAMIAAFAAGMLAALIYAVLTVGFMANQNVIGLTLTIFGVGLANFIGVYMVGRTGTNNWQLPAVLIDQMKNVNIPVLTDIPVLGKLLFNYDPFTYVGIAIALLCGWYLFRTKTGLNTQAIGENPSAADAASIQVTKWKYINILVGGGICAHRRRLLLHGHQRRYLDQRLRRRPGLDCRGPGHLRLLEAPTGHFGQLCIRRPAHFEVLYACHHPHCILRYAPLCDHCHCAADGLHPRRQGQPHPRKSRQQLFPRRALTTPLCAGGLCCYLCSRDRFFFIRSLYLLYISRFLSIMPNNI